MRSPHVSLVFNESGNEDPLTTPQFNSIEHTLNFFEAIKRTASCAVRLEFPLVGFTCDKPFFDRTRVLLTQLSSWTQTWKQQRERPQTQPLQTSVALSIDIGKLTASVALEDVSYGLDVLNARVLLGLRLGGLAGHNFVFSETRDLMFVDSSSDKPRSILSTTVPHFEVLDDRQQQPVTVVATGFFTLDPVLCTSQSDVRITLSNITWHYEAQSTWMQDLFTLIGGSELSTPHSSRFDRLMKLEVNARELSIDYRPSCLPTCAELIVETGQLSTTLIAHIPTTTIHLSMPRARILLMDSDLSMLPLDAAYGLVHDRYVALKYWTTLGFVDVATFNDLEVDIRTLLGISQVHGIDVRCRQVDVTTCADSYVTLRDFLGYVLGGNVDEEISHQDIASQISSDNVDVLQGLDEDAFGSGSMVNAEMPVEEMKDDDDDIITMLDISGLTIVDDYFSVSTSISQAKPVDDPPSELSWERIGSPIKEFDGTNPDDIVRVFDATIAINPHHFTVAGTGHHRTILPSSRFKLQISWSIDWHLFGGFDWRSNQELAAEKAERRRRKRAGAAHLSAEDTSIDEPAVEIFYDIDEESVSFTEESRSDESLFHMEMEDATSRRPTTPNTGHIPASTTARSKTSASESCSILPAYFKRSSTNQMQIRLHSFDIAYDSFEEGDQLSSRLVMSANDVEIIDDISTSTWRKFLTVPKPDFNDPRTARQTGSKDVRLEICHVHPQLGSKETEARVKVGSMLW